MLSILANVLVGLAVLALLALAGRALWKNHKKGGACMGCSGSCSCCGGSCHSAPKPLSHGQTS